MVTDALKGRSPAFMHASYGPQTVAKQGITYVCVCVCLLHI